MKFNKTHITIFFVLIFLFSFSFTPLKAECHLRTDSIESSRGDIKLSSGELNNLTQPDTLAEKFNPKQLILPGVLMASGLVGAIDYKNNLNKSVNDAFVGLSNGNSCKVDDYLRLLPSASHLLLGCFGVKSKHNFKERLLISVTSHAAMLIMGYGAKYTINEQRPDLSNNHSFPSGHVALAFTGAELLRSEYGTAYGIAGYVVATCVAALRLYNNKHWFNDVLMGAGIGILSARIGNWLLPFSRKLFKINNKNNSSSIVTLTPCYDSCNRALLVSMHAIF